MKYDKQRMEENDSLTGFKIVCGECESDALDHIVTDKGKDFFYCRVCGNKMKLGNSNISFEKIVCENV